MKKSSSFIPSPFKVVTEYENEFIRLWRENTAQGMVKLMKRIKTFENG